MQISRRILLATPLLVAVSCSSTDKPNIPPSAEPEYPVGIATEIEITNPADSSLISALIRITPDGSMMVRNIEVGKHQTGMTITSFGTEVTEIGPIEPGEDRTLVIFDNVKLGFETGSLLVTRDDSPGTFSIERSRKDQNGVEFPVLNATIDLINHNITVFEYPGGGITNGRAALLLKDGLIDTGQLEDIEVDLPLNYSPVNKPVVVYPYLELLAAPRDSDKPEMPSLMNVSLFQQL